MTDDRIASLYRKPCPSCAHDLPRDAHQCEFCGYTEAGEEDDQERLYVEYLTARLRQVQITIVEIVEESRQSVLDPVRARELRDAKAEVQALEQELAAHQAQPPQAPAVTPEAAGVQEMPPGPVANPAKGASARPAEPATRTRDAVVNETSRRSATAVQHAASNKTAATQRVILSEGVASERRSPRVPPKPAVAAPQSTLAPPQPVVAAPKPAVAPPKPAAVQPVAATAPRQMAEKTLWGDDRGICPACGATVSASATQCACGQVLESREAAGGAVCPHCTATVPAGQSHCSCGYPLSLGPQLPGIAHDGPSIPSINGNKDR
ncbi:MAG: hypothetical protein M0Z76_02555 [Gammaproteobacteria bacterium]|nr:hypothetical protein [Gammaproteobacteria bacterium]